MVLTLVCSVAKAVLPDHTPAVQHHTATQHAPVVDCYVGVQHAVISQHRIGPDETIRIDHTPVADLGTFARVERVGHKLKIEKRIVEFRHD